MNNQSTKKEFTQNKQAYYFKYLLYLLSYTYGLVDFLFSTFQSSRTNAMSATSTIQFNNTRFDPDTKCQRSINVTPTFEHNIPNSRLDRCSTRRNLKVN